MRQPIEEDVFDGPSAMLQRRRNVSLELRQPTQFMDVAGAPAMSTPSVSARHASSACHGSLHLPSRQHIELKVETSSDAPHASVVQASLQPSSPVPSGIRSPVLGSP